jgi:hypothetical protein
MTMSKDKGIRLSPKHGVNPMCGQCPLCAGDTNELFLLGRLPQDKEAPRKGVVPGMSQPCDKCQEYMKMGVMLIVVKDGSDPKNPYRTGEMHVIKEEAAARMFNDPNLLKMRAGFVEECVVRKLGFPIPNKEKSNE